MRRLLITLTTLTLASGLWSADATPAPATPPLTTPDVLATGWAAALKGNDLSGAFALFTPADQTAIANLWRRQMARPDAYADLQIDTVLRMAQNAAAADQLMAMSQPFLAMIDVPRFTKGITDVAGLLNTAADSQQPGTAGGLDYAGLREWLKDLGAWVPKAGFDDQNKAKVAAGHLVRALKASGLTSAAELRALPLADLLTRAAPALPALKEALSVYDMQIDALLGSFTAKLGEITQEQATIALAFTSLGKARTVNLKLVQKNGAWQLASGNDNPLTGLSQLVMMAVLMQGMGADPAQPPAKTAPPEDDGAL